jgi:hypothetical protein
MADFSLTTVSNLFKTKYAKVSENTYNSANVFWGRVMKSYDFTGRQMFKPVPQSFSGGVGSGTLPTPNYENVEDAILTAKKVYATCSIDRETIKASANDEGSFVRATKHVVQKTVESYMRNASRIVFNGYDATTNTGSIAAGDGSTNVSGAGTSGNPYLVTLVSTTKESNIEERDFWNYNAETTLLEVTAYNPSTNVVSLVGTSAGLAALSGAGPMLTTVFFYMQGSRGNDPMGLKSILRATTGSLYTIPVTRRWAAGALHDASGAGVTTDMMNADMLEIERKSGKVPNMIVTSFTQYRKILNLLEDMKTYNLPARSADLKGNISFKGVEFMSSAGAIGIFPERFVDDDAIYYLNDNFIEICHRPGHGWFDDDGTVFLRSSTADSYEARYGGYWEMYVAPIFHGTRHGLAV